MVSEDAKQWRFGDCRPPYWGFGSLDLGLNNGGRNASVSRRGRFFPILERGVP